MKHTAIPRYTQNMDVWVQPTIENGQRVLNALASFGAPVAECGVEDFTLPGRFFQIGVAPNRIDILAHISGVDFDTAWENRVESEFEGAPATFIGLRDLIEAKRAAGRPQDMVDVGKLLKAEERRRKLFPDAKGRKDPV